jgi:coronin-7
MGVCFLPKQSCDVREVEIARMLKLHSDKIEPVKFIVPRQRREFFQDDLFPPTRSIANSAIVSQNWSEGKKAEPILESVAPKNMTFLSVAPAVEKEKKPSSAYFLAKADEQKSQSNDAETIKGQMCYLFCFFLICFCR